MGAFEGANYEARGYFRPQADCLMFSRDQVPFCLVCQRAIATIVDLYSRSVNRAGGLSSVPAAMLLTGARRRDRLGAHLNFGGNPARNGEAHYAG